MPRKRKMTTTAAIAPMPARLGLGVIRRPQCITAGQWKEGTRKCKAEFCAHCSGIEEATTTKSIADHDDEVGQAKWGREIAPKDLKKREASIFKKMQKAVLVQDFEYVKDQPHSDMDEPEQDGEIKGEEPEGTGVPNAERDFVKKTDYDFPLQPWEKKAKTEIGGTKVVTGGEKKTVARTAKKLKEATTVAAIAPTDTRLGGATFEPLMQDKKKKPKAVENEVKFYSKSNKSVLLPGFTWVDGSIDADEVVDGSGEVDDDLTSIDATASVNKEKADIFRKVDGSAEGKGVYAKLLKRLAKRHGI